MADLARVKIELGGWSGAPGVSILNFSPGTIDWSSQSDVDAFYEELDTYTSTVASVYVQYVTIAVSPDLTIFDSETGNIQYVTGPTDAPTTYTSAASPSKTSRATMALVQFQTNKYINNRRLKGRMFLGPLAAESMTNDGLISTALQDAVPNWFAAMTSGIGPRLCVWHRPTASAPANGDYADVTSVSVRPTPSYLSSRLY